MSAINWVRRQYPIDAIGPSGSVAVSSGSPYTFVAEVGAYVGGAVVWTYDWEPVTPGGAAPTAWPSGEETSVTPQTRWPPTLGLVAGTLRLSATLDGIACSNTLVLVSIGGGGFPDYGSNAWETELSEPPVSLFWTNFRNAEEVA